jgi:hypothetical protein
LAKSLFFGFCLQPRHSPDFLFSNAVWGYHFDSVLTTTNTKKPPSRYRETGFLIHVSLSSTMRTANLVALVKPGSENHPVNSSIAGLNLRIKAVCYLPQYSSTAET